MGNDQGILVFFKALPSSISLGYECDFDWQCQSSDSRSLCHEGLCTCAKSIKKSKARRRRKKNIEEGDKSVAEERAVEPKQQLLLNRVQRIKKKRRKRVKRRSPRWFCNPRKPRLCPKGTFQVGSKETEVGKRGVLSIYIF